MSNAGAGQHRLARLTEGVDQDFGANGLNEVEVIERRLIARLVSFASARGERDHDRLPRQLASDNCNLGGITPSQVRFHDQCVKAFATELFGGRVDALRPDGAPALQLEQHRDGLCGVGIVVQYEDRWAAPA